MIRQAVILCGGLGTRLGALTASTPKPLLPVNGTPFLQTLIQEVMRCGVRNILLLAGHQAEQVVTFAAQLPLALNTDITVEVAIESVPAGTGGALYEARDRLDDTFLLLNGDSFLDIALWRLDHLLVSQPQAVGAVALRAVPDSGRYGTVQLDGTTINRFAEKAADVGPGLINGGVYLFQRTLLKRLAANCSLERDVLPGLAADGLLLGVESDGFFIDIGLPETFDDAQRALQAHRTRAAVFFDRDGVLNVDYGHVGTADRFTWNDGALAAIRLVNDHGYYAFIVTNQAGIAKGKYQLDDYWRLRDHVRSELADYGAQIDDERFCPDHPDAVMPEFRRDSPNRKPAPGMLLDLMQRWPVDRARSFLIGDQPSDLVAGRAAGLPSFHYNGGDLRDFVAARLKDIRSA